MTRLVRVKVERLTEEGFAPFGELLRPAARAPDFHGLASVGWKAGFESSGPPLIMTLTSRYGPLRCSMLERHLNVTQTFIPLGRIPSIVAVAAPTVGQACPAPEDVHAFLLDGSAGYVLKRGTWHSLDRFPLQPPSAEIVIITAHETQRELETVAPARWQFTRQVDYAEAFGVTFEFER